MPINDTISCLKGMSSVATVEMIVVDGSAAAETLKAITGSHVKGIVSGKGRGK